MKKIIISLCVLSALLISCATGPVDQRKTMRSLPDDVIPGLNQSEIIIQYTSSFIYTAKGLVNVFLDGQMVAQIEADTSERIIIPNGSHKLVIRQPGRRNINLSKKIDINSQRMAFSVSHVLFFLSLSKGKVTPLTGIGQAASTIAENLVKKLPRDATIAIVSISSNRPNDAEFVINELEHTLVNSGQFRIVNRNQLETIRREQHLHMSGDVSDESAVSIGQMSGASVVITGSIIDTGNTKTLSITELDVRSSEIITMERVHY
jgi:hypothetical protein